MLADGDDVLAVDAAGLAPKPVEDGDEFGVDLAVEHLLDDLHGFGIGDAQSLDEVGLEPFLLHAGVDGLAAAMDDDGAEADATHEGDVLEDVADDVGVVHGGAAELDDDGFAPEPLDVRQGLDEDAGFLDGLFHS